mmetsp:Transcript_1047/g.1476  ORF Transcript_1047/g.1476 Transcript_1047/m.1476 type:complete len:1131 (+) Transcript_1047:49-3441(+)
MASDRAEHLIILNDACKGLLCRVHWMAKAATPACLESKELGQLLKTFKKSFPKISAKESEQVKGFEIFRAKAEVICQELEDWYKTIRDVVAFNDKAFKCLNAFAADVSALDWSNLHLMALFFELLSGIVKLQIALQKVPNKARNISSYIAALELVQGKKDDHLSFVLEYMKAAMANQEWKYEDRIWVTVGYLRDRSVHLLTLVRGVAKTLWRCIQKWSIASSFEKHRLFSILYDASRIVQPAQTGKYLELEYLNRFREWYQFALLVCPAALQEAEARFCLNKILALHFNVPVFRDVSFDLGKVWDKTFWEFKCGHKTQGTKFYLKTHRDLVFKEAYVKANDTALEHRALRRYLHKNLRQYVCLFTEIPGLAAPKFQLVLALMKLASEEIHWYFQHRHSTPFKHRKINWISNLSSDKTIVKLIEALVDICSLTLKFTPLVKEYFIEYIKEVDAPKVETELKKFFQYCAGKIPQDVQTTMMGLLKQARNATLKTSFTKVQLDFFRVTCWLSSRKTGIAFQTCAPVLAVFNELYTHFGNVLHTEQQLVENANIGSIIWYAEEFKEMVVNTLGSRSLYSSCMTLMHILGYVKYDLNLKYCPDEQQGLIKMTIRYGEMVMDEICKTILKNYISMGNFQAYLDKTIDINIQIQNLSHDKKKHAMVSQNIIPGSESIYGGDAYYNFQAQAQGLGLLLDAVRQVKQCQVFTVVFNTYDWLYEAMDKYIFQKIQAITIDNGSIRRPSQILRLVEREKRAMSYVEQHIPLNTSDLIRGNMLKHFTKTSAGLIGDNLVIDSKSSALIHKIGKFYWDILKSNVDFSPLNLVFKTKVHGKRAKDEVLAEEYTSHPELCALCRFVGPYGVKALQSIFLSNLANGIVQLKSVVAKNGVYLGQLDFVDMASWWGNVVKVTEKDEFLRSAIHVGRCLQFLSLLKTSQRAVQDDSIPFVSKVVHLVTKRIESDGKIKAGAQLCNVLIDSGVEDPKYNLGVRNVFKKVFDNKAVLSHFPKMFACLFISEIWKDTKYTPDSEGFSTGVESLITTIQTVIPALCETEKKTKEHLKDFVVLSAYALLHMNSKVESQDREMRGYHIPSMMTFMSKFMESCKGIMSMHVLEECLPFTLIRTKIIEIYEKMETAK